MKTKDFLGNEWDIECMGCEISNGSMLVPGGIIQKTPNFYVHQDPLVPLPGLLVIASSRHIRSLSQMRADELEEFFGLVEAAHRAIKEVIDVEYLTTIQEEISVHFHLWFFPWTRSIIEHYGIPSLTKIRDIMADYRKLPIGEAEWKELETSLKEIKRDWQDNEK